MLFQLFSKTFIQFKNYFSVTYIKDINLFYCDIQI